jgi:hypothetical protein
VLKKTGSLLDVALCAGWLLENGAVPPKRTDPFRQRLEKWAGGFPDLPPLEGVEPPDPLDTLRILARKLQEDGRFVCTRQELEELLRQKLTPASPAVGPSAEGEAASPAGPPSAETESSPESAPPAEQPAPERPPAPEPKRVRAALASFLKAFPGPRRAPGRLRSRPVPVCPSPLAGHADR